MEENKKVETENNEAAGTTSTAVQSKTGDNKENVIVGLKTQLKRKEAENAKLREGVVAPEGETSSDKDGDVPDWVDTEKKYKKAQTASIQRIATLEGELGKVNRENRIKDVCSRLGCPVEIFEGVTTDQEIINKIIEWREDTTPKKDDAEKADVNAGKFETGAGMQSGITAEKIQNMSSEEFAKYEKQLDDETRRKERTR